MILARDIALSIGGRTAQPTRVRSRGGSGRFLRGRSGANPRLHLRAGEDRTADRGISDVESIAAPAELRRDNIRAVLQTGDEPDDASARVLFERAADIATVDI